MQAAHLICRRDNGVDLNNLSYDRQKKVFLSGHWEMSEQEAAKLVGGWLYLHPTKGAASEFGGIVVDYEPVVIDEAGRRRRVVLHVQKCPEGTGQRWRGAQHAMAHQSGLVDADLPHEA